MAKRAPAWVVPVMRAGYAARGVVYVVVGALALNAAWTGGRAEGTTGAIAAMRDTGFGAAILWAVAIGLFAYALWRGLAAAMDLESHGEDGSGWIARAGLTVSAVIHAALGIYAARVAMGGGGSGGGGTTEDWTAQVLQVPAGRWIVMIGGLIVIGAGGYYAWKGWSESYRERLKACEATRELGPVCKVGLIAHGAAIAIIGGFFVYAGWTASAEEAGGLAQAFQTVREAPFGRILLGLLALGMVAFAVECFVQAVYRIVPRRAGPDISTLAGAARAEAREKAAQAT